MEYLLMIYADEDKLPEMTQAMRAEYQALNAEMQTKGAFLGANRLHPPTTATTIKVRQDQVLTTDGPFAETKEHLAGYYLLECQDLDEALAWAKRLPVARLGTIEVRPVISGP